MAAADTALLAQESFGARIEHARYLTVHDLTAIMAMQYQHQGLQPLWPVIETALLAPDEEEWLDAPPEPLLRYASGEVQIALLDPGAWQQRNGQVSTATRRNSNAPTSISRPGNASSPRCWRRMASRDVCPLPGHRRRARIAGRLKSRLDARRSDVSREGFLGFHAETYIRDLCRSYAPMRSCGCSLSNVDHSASHARAGVACGLAGVSPARMHDQGTPAMSLAAPPPRVTPPTWTSETDHAFRYWRRRCPCRRRGAHLIRPCHASGGG